MKTTNFQKRIQESKINFIPSNIMISDHQNLELNYKDIIKEHFIGSIKYENKSILISCINKEQENSEVPLLMNDIKYREYFTHNKTLISCEDTEITKEVERIWGDIIKLMGEKIDQAFTYPGTNTKIKNNSYFINLPEEEYRLLEEAHINNINTNKGFNYVLKNQ